MKQIDKSYKSRPKDGDEAYYGCDHTESYIDEPHSIVCVEGWMIDVDNYMEGWFSHNFKHPCRNCNPLAFQEYLKENE